MKHIVPDIDTVLKELSLQLYEKEEKRKKMSLQFIGSQIAELILFAALLLSSNITIELGIFLLVLFLLNTFFLLSIIRKRHLLVNNFKQNIVANLVKLLSPELDYKPEGKMPVVQDLLKMRRFSPYKGLRIDSVRDSIEGKIGHCRVLIVEMSKVWGSMPGVEEDVPGLFQGLIIQISTGEFDTLKLRAAFGSSAMLEAFQKLNQFWSSYPQVTVLSGGLVSIEILFPLGSHFLELPKRGKLYSYSYFEKLYQEINLLLDIVRIADEELS